MYKGKAGKRKARAFDRKVAPDHDGTLGMSQFALDLLNLGKAGERVLWFYEKWGRCIKSSAGTVSRGWPALRQAVNPPTITKALNPRSLSMCTTRALVASRIQVQYR